MTSGEHSREVTWREHPQVVERPPWTTGRRVGSWIWALTPVLTVGIATAPAFLYAAVTRRTRGWWLAFAGYTTTTVVIFWSSGFEEGSAGDTATAPLAVVMWLVASGHAIATRQRVFEPPAQFDQLGEPVIAQALHGQQRRELARQILAQEPHLASDLGIGRPDLGRGYDDGGLVDVNSAPPELLGTLPGFDAVTVGRVVAARNAASGFSSLEELVVLADVHPTLIDRLRDRLVLSPRS